MHVYNIILETTAVRTRPWLRTGASRTEALGQHGGASRITAAELHPPPGDSQSRVNAEVVVLKTFSTGRDSQSHG